MDINGKRILVLGAYGQVGSAIVKLILRASRPAEFVLCSLWPDEARAIRGQCEQWIERFQSNVPKAKRTKVKAHAGNILWSRSLEELLKLAQATEDDKGSPLSQKEKERRQAEYTAAAVSFVYKDFNQFTPEEREDTILHSWLTGDKPEIVIDCVNTATGLAYMDIFTLGKSYLKQKATGKPEQDGGAPFAELVLASAALPALVRHLEILKSGMAAAGTKIYLKVGTTGTGGMGLNIPYTHSESKPSRQLMSKSAIAGAASLLYLLLSRTKDAPLIKEIKPAALIGWKGIGYGPIRKHGQPLPLCDCSLDQGRTLKDFKAGDDESPAQLTGEHLQGVYIDTGENGVFTAAEFESITALEQMELVTPEDCARAAVEEIMGESTGFDIVGSLSAVCLDSTYRGGVMRNHALEQLAELEREHGESVAFEILGPPKLSKLLWEAFLIKRFGRVEELIRPVFQEQALSLERRLEQFDAAYNPEALCEQITAALASEGAIRQRIISIGIPICTSDDRWLYGPQVALMRAFPGRRIGEMLASQKYQSYFLENGAVALNPGNMRRWGKRLQSALRYHCMFSSEGDGISSSTYDYRRFFTTHNSNSGGAEHVELHIGELVGWLFVTEEDGSRRRHVFHPDQI
jgi:hypothetical protein